MGERARCMVRLLRHASSMVRQPAPWQGAVKRMDDAAGCGASGSSRLSIEAARVLLSVRFSRVKGEDSLTDGAAAPTFRGESEERS